MSSGRSRPVRSITTGVVYRSILEASRANGKRNGAQLHKHLTGGVKFFNLQKWEYIQWEEYLKSKKKCIAKRINNSYVDGNVRYCLKCEGEFISISTENRLCTQCKNGSDFTEEGYAW